MKLAILQPVLVPDLHDLAVIKAVDKVVIQDCEQWSRKGRTHRAQIRTPEGTQYFHVPVKTEDRKKAISEVRIDHRQNWIDPIIRSLRYNYRNSVYYDFYEPEIQADFLEIKNYQYLMQAALFLRMRIFQYLEIDQQAEILFCRDLPEYHSNPDLLANRMGAEIFYQEHDARNYQRQGEKRSELNFQHPVYRQHFEGFEPNCCLFDLLFQYGPESFRILDDL